jgi:hypothetical protein
MNDHKPDSIVEADNATSPVTFDHLITRLSDKDRQVRKSAVLALGSMGDAKAVEPLIFVLSKELTRDAGSYPVIIEILDAMSKTPDSRILDALVKVESQMTDRDSPESPAGLPAGVITYRDTRDGCIRRAVPRQLHFKILDVMRRMSIWLHYREEQVSSRFSEYQQEVIRAEIERIMPDMAELLQGNNPVATQPPFNGADNSPDNVNGNPAEAEPQSGDTMAGIDFESLRREMEKEVADYLADNTKMLDLIREGQRIKAHIRQGKMEKAKFEAEGLSSGKVSAR